MHDRQVEVIEKSHMLYVLLEAFWQVRVIMQG